MAANNMIVRTLGFFTVHLGFVESAFPSKPWSITSKAATRQKNSLEGYPSVKREMALANKLKSF